MAEHNDFGKRAEEFVSLKYQKNGYTIRERNWRFYPLEVDIIAQKGNVLAIVEVKARTSECFGSGEEAVTQAKKKRLIAVADEYIQQNKLDVECRFDIAVVTQKKDGLVAKMFIDAFWAHEV